MTLHVTRLVRIQKTPHQELNASECIVRPPGHAMSDYYKPRDCKDVEAAVQWAIAGGKSLEIIGHGSKRLLGRPAQYDATLDLSGMAGVILYEPQELILSAKAGTPLAEITALLASSGQELAFEPMDYGPLLGGAQGRGTIGGMLAANVPAPRATIFLASSRCRDGARPSSPAAAWSRTLPGSICANCWPDRGVRSGFSPKSPSRSCRRRTAKLRS